MTAAFNLEDALLLIERVDEIDQAMDRLLWLLCGPSSGDLRIKSVEPIHLNSWLQRHA